MAAPCLTSSQHARLSPAAWAPAWAFRPKGQHPRTQPRRQRHLPSPVPHVQLPVHLSKVGPRRVGAAEARCKATAAAEHTVGGCRDDARSWALSALMNACVALRRSIALPAGWLAQSVIRQPAPPPAYGVPAGSPPPAGWLAQSVTAPQAPTACADMSRPLLLALLLALLVLSGVRAIRVVTGPYMPGRISLCIRISFCGTLDAPANSRRT